MNKSFLISDDFINSRLDRWLRRNICEIPQSLIEKNLRRGRIKVNNKKKKSSYKLLKNDKIDLYNFSVSERINKNLIVFLKFVRTLFFFIIYFNLSFSYTFFY